MFSDKAVKLDFFMVEKSPFDIITGLSMLTDMCANMEFGSQSVRLTIASEEMVLPIYAKSTKNKLVEGEKLRTPGEEFKSDLNSDPVSSHYSEEEAVLAICEDKYSRSDGDPTSEEATTDEKEKTRKMRNELRDRLAHLKK